MSLSPVPTYRIAATDNKRKALEYTAWLLKNIPDVTSILDIGCADGIVATILPDKMPYIGFDIGADIYSRTADPRISYVEDVEALMTAIRSSEPRDATLLYDTLEHTDDFTSFFEVALEKSKKYVFVSLPNEQNLMVILGLLGGKTPGPHSVAMYKSKKGHRHQWFIGIAEARQVLSEVARQHGYRLKSEVYYNHLPKSPAKRVLREMATGWMPPHLRSIGFALLFARE